MTLVACAVPGRTLEGEKLAVTPVGRLAAVSTTGVVEGRGHQQRCKLEGVVDAAAAIGCLYSGCAGHAKVWRYRGVASPGQHRALRADCVHYRCWIAVDIRGISDEFACLQSC